MKRKLAFLLAILMILPSFSEIGYALSFKDEETSKRQENFIDQKFSLREENFGQSLQARKLDEGKNSGEDRSATRNAPAGDDEFTAIVEEAQGENIIKRSNKAGNFTIVFPAMSLKTSKDQGGKTYQISLANASIVKSINDKSIDEVAANDSIMSVEIRDRTTNSKVGTVQVVKENGNIVVKYIFDRNDAEVTYNTGRLSLDLETKETNDESYTLLPGSSGEVKVDFYGFNLEGPTYTGDKKSATVNVSKKDGYKLGEIKDVSGVPSNVDYTNNGNIHTFKLKSGEYASFNATFSDGTGSQEKSIELGVNPDIKPTYTPDITPKIDIDGDKLIASVTLKKDPKEGSPELPKTIDITSFTLTNGASKIIPESEQIKFKEDGPLETKDNGVSYNLKKEVKLTGEGNKDTKTYKLEIPVDKWMTFKNDYDYLKASWKFKYNYGEDKTKDVSDSYVFPKEEIALTHSAKVAPSADTGENFLYESLEIRPANGKNLPDGFKIKISDREVLFPENVKSNNKFELSGEGVEKKDPWIGYDIKGDKNYTYNGGDKKYQIVKVNDKGRKFHYKIEWKTKVNKLPNNYWVYGNPGARSKTKITYTYEGKTITTTTNEKIPFFKIVKKPSDKLQIAQETNDKGERITTWAIVFNRDHKRKAVTEVSDTLKHGTFIEDSLKYYFINPKEKIPNNGKEINDLLKEKKSNDVARDANSAKPFYTITKDVEEGKERFVIKFGDHSNILKEKIEGINAKYSNYTTDKEQESKRNVEIIHYIFPDYVYRESEAGTKITSKGDYFKDTNQEDSKRNFPNLSDFKIDISGGTADIPFTSLIDSYVTLKKAKAGPDDKLAYYLLDEKKEEKSDALIITYQTKSYTKPEDNQFESKWFSEFPNVTIIELNKDKKLDGPDGSDVYPQLRITGPDTEDETGEKKETNEQEGLYPVAKYSFIDDDMTQIKNGVLANIKGSYCEEIDISDEALMTNGQIGEKYTDLKLVRFKLGDFDDEIEKLKGANTKEKSESDEAYNKRIYNTFIENYIKGKGGTPEGKKVEFTPSNDNKSINFKTGVNENNFKDNHYVYLFTYNMDASYAFNKSGEEKATINNTASVKYDKGMTLKSESKIEKPDFLTKEDITSETEPKTSGVKTYRLSFDFSKYQLKDMREIKITDSFGDYDKFVEITDPELLKGPLKVKTDPTAADEYENAPQGVSLKRDGKVFTVKSNEDLSGKKFTIIYSVKMDLSKIYDGGQGDKDITNTASAVIENENTPPQTIKESASATTGVQYGEFLKKSVDKWADNANDNDIKEFKKSTKRHYKLTFSLKNKEFLKNAKTLEVKDTFSDYHDLVEYDDIKLSGKDTANLKMKVKSKGDKEILFEVTKKNESVQFPDEFALEYDVILKNADIVKKAGGEAKNKEGASLTNEATAVFTSDNASYLQKAKATTLVLAGSLEVEIQKFTINLEKVLPQRIIGKGKSDSDIYAPLDYSKISFQLKGKYKVTENGAAVEKDYDSKELQVSSDGSLMLDKIPFNGEYTLTETVDPKSDYKALKNPVKFKVSADGKEITFVDGSLEMDKAEVTSINSKSCSGDDRIKGQYRIDKKSGWSFVVKMGLKVHNELKPNDKHTLIFRKVDQNGKPLQGAKFKITKEDGTDLLDNNSRPVYKSSDKDGIVKFENLSNGTYKVEETEYAPGRYSDKMEPFEIKLTKDMSKEYNYGDVTNKKLTLHNISFIKAEIQNKDKENERINLLQGAEFKLMKKGSRGEFLVDQTATSGDDGKVTFTNVAGGTYKIEESKAPVGYGLPTNRTVIDEFQVKEDESEDYYDWSKDPVTEKKVVENSKIKHKVSFVKYKEVYKGKPQPMEGAIFILQEKKGDKFESIKNGEDFVTAKSDNNGLVSFDNLDNKQYQIIEAPAASDDPKSSIKGPLNSFADYDVNTNVIKVPDLTEARDKALDIKLFTDDEKIIGDKKVNSDEKFINYKMRRGFSFKKLDEALDEKGKPKAMKGVIFKAYRKVDGKFEDEVYRYLNNSNPANPEFKNAVAVSDEKGDVIFKGFENGTYKIVETRLPGYEEMSFEIEVSKDGVTFPREMTDGKSNIVKNSYTRHNISFKKVDSVTKAGIEGAVFKLERLEKDGKYSLVKDNLRSNSQGIVSAGPLLNGEYKISEVKAPVGYMESDLTFKFKLSDSDLKDISLKDVENESLPKGYYSGFNNEGNLLNKKDHYAYMYGYPDNTFRPSRSMTRAEATAMFGRLLLKRPTKSKEFKKIYSDVNKDDWYASAITIMTELNIVKGYEDGSFKPNNPITRAEFATMASQFDKLSGGSLNFTDVNTSHWAYSYIASAYNKGWISGYPDGSFKPEKSISREEVVSITNRMLDRKCDLDFVKKNKSILIMFKDNPETSWSYGDIIEATNGHEYHRKNGSSIEEVWERLNHKEFHV